MKPSETKAEFARRLGVSKSTVTRAARAGRLVLDSRGRVLIEESIKRWNDTKGGRTDVEARHARARGRKIPASEPAGDEIDDDDEDMPESEGERTKYKAQALFYDNALIKIGLALQLHQRFRREDVIEEAARIGGRINAGMEQLVDNTAPRMVMTTDPAARRQIIEESVHQLLASLDRDRRNGLKRIKRKSEGTT